MNSARPQAFDAKHALLQVICRDPVLFMPTVLRPDAAARIRAVWDHVGADYPAEERVSGAGIAVEHVDISDAVLLACVKLPAEAANELALLGIYIDRAARVVRVFGVELALPPLDSMLVEYAADARTSYGPAGLTVADFTRATRDVLDERRAPLTRTTFPRPST